MSYELITAVSSLLTAAVIAATAIAAVVQLRHMRAGNAVQAMLSFRKMLEDAEHRSATALLRSGDLDRVLEDPQFRRYLYRTFKKLPVGDIPAQYKDLNEAAIMLGNSFESLGGMIRNRIVDPRIFLATYWWVVVNHWSRLEKYIALGREYSGSQGLFEDFEHLTVLSREWSRKHPDTYPRGVDRIPLVNMYPLEQEPWIDEDPVVSLALRRSG